MNLEERLELHQQQQASMYSGIDEKRTREVTDDLIANVKEQYNTLEIKKAQLPSPHRADKSIEATKTQQEFGQRQKLNTELANNLCQVGLSPSGSVIPLQSPIGFTFRPETARSLIKRFREERLLNRPFSERGFRLKTAQPQLISKTRSCISNEHSSTTTSSSDPSMSRSGNLSSSRERDKPALRTCFR